MSRFLRWISFGGPDLDEAKKAAEVDLLKAQAEATRKQAEAQAEALIKQADAQVKQSNAQAAATTKQSDIKLLVEKILLGAVAVGAVGITTRWLHYYSPMVIKWRIKRFLKHRKQPSPSFDRTKYVTLPLRLQGLENVPDVYSKPEFAHRITDKITKSGVPHYVIAPSGQGKSTLLQYLAHTSNNPSVYIGFRISKPNQDSVAATATTPTSKLLADGLYRQLDLPIPRHPTLLSGIKALTVSEVKVELEALEHDRFNRVLQMLFAIAVEIYDESGGKKKVLLIFDEIMDILRTDRAGVADSKATFNEFATNIRKFTSDANKLGIICASSSSFLRLAFDNTSASKCHWATLSMDIDKKAIRRYLLGHYFPKPDDSAKDSPDTTDVKKSDKPFTFTKRQVDQIIAACSTRLRPIIGFTLIKTFDQAMDTLRAKAVRDFEKIISQLKNPEDLARARKHIQALAKDGSPIALRFFPESMRTAEVLNEVFYLTENNRLIFQLPIYGDVWLQETSILFPQP